ncbi:MAG: glycosyltransferase, partial [Puniceicoccales bacterium]
PVCPALADTCRELAPQTPLSVLHDVTPPKPDVRPAGVLNLRDLVGSDGPIALYVGNFEGYQGVDILLDAMEKVGLESPLRLVLVGGGKNAESLRQRIETTDLKGRVFLPGPQPLDQLPFLLEQADILVSPRSQGVNTPMKVYAYLQSGRAILATRILSHTQVMSEEHVYLADPNPEALAEGLVILSQDSSLRARLAQSARVLSETRFSRKALGDRITGAYRAEADD